MGGEVLEGNEVAQQIITEETLRILSQLYNETCTCIKLDDKKEDMLNPVFHTEECAYAQHLKSIDFKYD